MSAPDPVWDELGKIDYLLDQLARAVDRGELGPDAWDRLSPRYYERRAELAAVLTSRAARSGTASSVAAPAPDTTTAAPAASAAAAPQAPTPAPLPLAYAPPRVEPAFTGSTAPDRSSAGTWMSYAGALLVVIAVAIFTIYAWATFPPLLKLAVLLGVTAVFYVGGEVVRVKLDLPAVGVALISVGSAMLLFDGWSVIRAIGVTGPLPWALMLLLCSLAYWATEWRITGGWFGAIGAAAQVGWWWMLGQALGWEPYWVAAGVSGVAAVWALASARAEREGPLGTLAAVLRVGSVLLAAVTAMATLVSGVTAQIGGPPTYWPLAAAVASALSFTVVVERLSPRSRGLSALGHLPVFLVAGAYWGALAAAGRPGPGWALLATLLAMAVAYDVYAPWRGSAAYAVAGLVAEGMLWLGLADRYAWRSDVTVGVLLVYGLSAMLAGRLLRRADPDAGRWPGASWAARTWEYGGVAVMALATVLVPAVGGLPLSGAHIEGGTVLLALGVLVAWVAGSIIRRSGSLGRVAVGWSFYALAAGSAWAYPSWHSAWYGVALLCLAAVLSQSRTLVEKLLHVPGEEVGLFCRVLYVALPVFALLGSVIYFRLGAYPVSALLAVAGLAWCAEALRARERWVLAPSAASLVAAVAVAGWVARGLPDAAIAGAATALAFAAVGALGPRRFDSWGAFAGAGGALAATVITLAAVDDARPLALSLVLLACAWALTAIAAALPELGGVAAVFGSFSLLAALSWCDASPWVTVVALAVFAGASLVPRVFSRAAAASKRLRMARALAVSGAFALAELCLIGLLSYTVGGRATPSGWMDLGATGAAVALALGGGYIVSWTTVERFEPGLYPGIALVVFGAMVQMDGWGIRDQEWFLVLAALYFAGMGVLWASRKTERRVPVGTDVAAFAVGVALPFMLAVGGWDGETALRHGLWALGLAAASTAIGLLSRTRVYFQGGLAVLVLDAVWLSRSVLFALPSWIWIGTVGLALIAGGVVYARREKLGGVGRRIREGFATWR